MNIIRLLAEKKLGVTELARRSAVPRSTINDLIRGETGEATADTINKLAHGFGVARGELLTEKAASPDVEAVIKEFRRTAEAQTLDPPFDEDDADRMRASGRYAWTGERPKPKALRHLVIFLRLQAKVEDRS